MRITILTFSLLFITSAYALTDAWSVDVNAHAAVQRTYKQGESHELRIILRDGLKPVDLTGATARWFWYTNTVQNVWWTNAASVTAPKAGLVAAQWTPAMDTGASLYAYWVGIWMPGSTSPLWRVTGTIRMLPSPGFTPNALMPPVRTLDFASIALTNAPWATAADWISGSNALASSLQDVSSQAESNRVALASLPPPSTASLPLTNAIPVITYTQTVTEAVGWTYVLTLTSELPASGGPGVPMQPQRVIFPTNTVTLTPADWSLIDPDEENSVNIAYGPISAEITEGEIRYDPSGPTTELSLYDGASYWVLVCDAAFTGMPVAVSWLGVQRGALSYEYVRGVDVVVTHAVPLAAWYAHTMSLPTVVQMDAAIDAATSGLSSAWTNSLLYASGGTNFYPRWDSDLQTYVVTGVPQ